MQDTLNYGARMLSCAFWEHGLTFNHRFLLGPHYKAATKDLTGPSLIQTVPSPLVLQRFFLADCRLMYR